MVNNMKPTVRQSNMELLRIIAMLMVVALHACTGGFGYVRTGNVHQDPAGWLGVTLTTMVCIGCVDVFVLITGWFGTHFRWKGALRLVAQTAFVASMMYVVVAATGNPLPRTFGDAMEALWSYWFVQSYLLLYVLSPLLNAFIDRADERQLGSYVATFYAFYVPLSFVNSDIANGYSTFSFVGLYLLGRYLRLYGAARLRTFVRSWHLVMLWTFLTAGMAFAIWAAAMWGTQATTHDLIRRLTAYSNPLVIIGACSLLLLASRLHFTSRVVNFLAAGSFTVYLTHQQLFLRKPYFQLIRDIDYQLSSPMLCFLAVTGVVVGVYLASAFFDWGRQWLFRKCGL